MVRSHARNNTTQANLTYYERSLLRQPNAAKRVGGESFKPLDSCNLCLSKVNDPVACTHGHLYCRECVISNLITQKAGIEVQKKELERWHLAEEREKAEAKQRARDRVVADFEKNMGLGYASASASGSNSGSKSSAPPVIGPSSSANGTSTSSSGGSVGISASGSGRVGEKYTLNNNAMESAATKAEEQALARIEAEQAEARKVKLPAYWLPSLAPEEKKVAPLKDIKLQTTCQLGKDGVHPMSRKTLLPVILHYPTGSTKPSCPSCTKELSNSSSPILLSSRTPATSTGADDDADAQSGPKKKKAKKDKEAPYVCGHVICNTCSDRIVKPGKRCPVCEAEIGDQGIIPLGKEGTGFAAAGGAEVKKDAVVFRV